MLPARFCVWESSIRISTSVPSSMTATRVSTRDELTTISRFIRGTSTPSSAAPRRTGCPRRGGCGKPGGLPLTLEGEGRPRDPEGRDHAIQVTGRHPPAEEASHHRRRLDAACGAHPQAHVPCGGRVVAGAGEGLEKRTGVEGEGLALLGHLDGDGLLRQKGGAGLRGAEDGQDLRI